VKIYGCFVHMSHINRLAELSAWLISFKVTKCIRYLGMCICVRVYVCVCVCVHVRMCVRAFSQTASGCLCIARAHTCTYTYAHTITHTRVHTHTCARVLVHANARRHIRTHTHIHTDIHTHTHTHTHSHTYSHTPTHSCPNERSYISHACACVLCVCMCVRMRVRVYACACVCVCIRVYTCVCECVCLCGLLNDSIFEQECSFFHTQTQKSPRFSQKSLFDREASLYIKYLLEGTGWLRLVDSLKL